MKKCPTCQQMNPGGANFCKQCGASLPGKKKSNKRALLLAGVLGAAIGCSVVGLFWVMNGDGSPAAGGVVMDKNSSSYQELIDQGAEFLAAKDLPNAEKNYLQASELEPKQVLPYEMLYSIYTMQANPTKAEEIKTRGELNIMEEEKPGFIARVDKITQDSKPDPVRQIIADLGPLDFTPMSFDEQGWLLVKDGQYKFLLPDGTIQEASGADSILLWDSEAPKQTACLSGSTGYIFNQGSLKTGGGCGAGGVGNVTHPYILDANNTVVLTATAQRMQNSPIGGVKDFSITSPIVVSHQEQAAGDYYIYLPNTDTLHGPYAESESATFYSAAKKIPNLDILGDHQKTSGPFWIHNPEEAYGHADGIQNRFSLLTEDGSKKLEGFSEAHAVDAFSIGGHKSNRFYSYDRGLNEVYNGLFQAGATAINGTAPVMTDGTWKLISLAAAESAPEQAEQPEKPATSTPETGDQNAGTAQTLQKTPAKTEEAKPAPAPEPKADFSAFAGDYSMGGGAASIGLSIQPDGTFTAVSGDADAGVREESYPKGTFYSAKAHGTLELVAENRIRIATLVHEVPVGTSEIKDQMKIVYSEVPSVGLGDELQFFPVGSPKDSLPDGAKYVVYDDSPTLQQALLVPSGVANAFKRN